MDHLQSLGPNICAMDIVEFVQDQQIQEEFGLETSISLRTAQGWMHQLSFRWRPIPNGQYVDGHERPDVKEARDAYLKEIEGLQK